LSPEYDQRAKSGRGRETRKPDEDSSGDERGRQAGIPGLLLGLQQKAGNAAVARLVAGTASVAPAESAAEKGAESLAPTIGRALGGGGQGAPLPPPVGGGSADTGSGGLAVPEQVRQELPGEVGKGDSLPAPVLGQLQSNLGVDASPVRLHADQKADRLATALEARAFTAGSDIFFRRGEYSPGSAEGRHVLSHELAHVARGDAAGRLTRLELSGEQKSALFGRAVSMDYNLLADVAAKAPIVSALSGLAGGGDKSQRDTEAVDREMLKQQVLVSRLPAETLAETVREAVDSKDPGPLRKKLLKGKSRSSGEVYRLVADCRALVNDYYRTQQKDAGAQAGDLKRTAKSYDEGGSTEFAGKLAHTETKSRLFGLVQTTKTRTHTMEDVIAKATTVAEVDLRHTTSPESMPSGEVKAPPRPKIGVVGGGPIGLMAALESRLSGADVVMFEARSDEYSRRQVLALDSSTLQKFAKFGILGELLKDGDRKGDERRVAVKYIEKALRARALELGVEIRTGWFLGGAKEGEDGKTRATFQVGQDKRKAQMRQEELDLLVVAAGAGLSRANKYTGAVLGDELGFKFHVRETKDYAVVGLFQPTKAQAPQTEGGGGTPQSKRWFYRFDTPKVTYVLQQIPEELHKEFTGKGGEEKMREFIRKVAEEKGVTSPFAHSQNKRGQKTPNVGTFPIEIQQAEQFVNEKLRTLLIGDSAGTPHPKTGSGLNTGVRELDALAEVVEALRSEIALRAGGNSKQGGDEEGEAPEPPGLVRQALERYNTEIKGLTDTMVGKALGTLVQEHAKLVKDTVVDLQTKYGGVLASDYALGGRVESIKAKVLELMMNGWKDYGSGDSNLSYLREVRAELDRIRSELESMAPKST